MNLPSSYEQKIRAFLAAPRGSTARVQWIHCTHVKVYVRKSQRRFLDIGLRETIEIANVEVLSKYQRSGLYSALLALFDECAGDRVVYIENVHFEEHYPIYLRRGFTQDPNSYGYSANFYKMNVKERIIYLIYEVSKHSNSNIKVGVVLNTTKLGSLGWRGAQFDSLEELLNKEFETTLFHKKLTLRGDEDCTVDSLAAFIQARLDDEPVTYVQDRVCQVIQDVLRLTKPPALDATFTDLKLTNGKLERLQVALLREFPDFQVDYSVQKFLTVRELVQYIEAFGVEPKAAEPKVPEGLAKAPQPYSDAWLYQHCDRFSKGLISNIEFVLQLQLPPDVVSAALQVSKLPYRAASKIEVSDLMHDDPRSDATEEASPLYQEKTAIKSFLEAIRLRMQILDGINIECLHRSRFPRKIGIKLFDGGFHLYSQHIASQLGSTAHVDTINNIVWAPAQAFTDAGISVPDVILAHLNE